MTTAVVAILVLLLDLFSTTEVEQLANAWPLVVLVLTGDAAFLVSSLILRRLFLFEFKGDFGLGGSGDKRERFLFFEFGSSFSTSIECSLSVAVVVEFARSISSNRLGGSENGISSMSSCSSSSFIIASKAFGDNFSRFSLIWGDFLDGDGDSLVGVFLPPRKLPRRPDILSAKLFV